MVPPFNGVGRPALDRQHVIFREILLELRPQIHLFEVVRSVQVLIAGDDKDPGWLLMNLAPEFSARFLDGRHIAGTKDQEIRQHARLLHNVHMIERCIAAGNPIHALNMTRELHAAKRVQVGLQHGHEFEIVPVIPAC